MSMRKKSNIEFLSFDLDGTLTGNPDATLRFKLTFEQLNKSERPLLCYNSGRLLKSTLDLISATDLPVPEYCICGVGTLIYDFKNKNVIKEFNSTLTTGWDIDKVRQITGEFSEIIEQPKKFQDKFKSSWYLYDADELKIKEIEDRLKAEGLKINLVYSSSRDLDILPVYANKGNALKWLIDYIDIKSENVIVGGDTGNDSSMFLVPGVKGIVVENSQPELYAATIQVPTYISKQRIADGILEGLVHYGVVSDIAKTENHIIKYRRYAPSIQAVLRSNAFNELDLEQTKFVETGYEKAIEALKKNITSIGFSPCSLSDNAFFNTDENYRSIWARDGAITVINSLTIEDQDIKDCQRHTLETLLQNVSSSGQVPSNVRIDDNTADYSGVGGICSIDSGLWLIIAIYNYMRSTRDYDFLRSNADTFRKIMFWLWTHDSNNDYLIEVPEAGDWTDLFGRSYNVLYDEVLWYYCNLCAGRIEELLGSYQEAEQYLRKAQIIKEIINKKFWPSIHNNTLNSFADQQYSLGDTHYLIAEITPFGFDWRCDVLGNVLAGLFNVIPMERARTAFRFMWGVGVNEPAPVNNLYPPVTAGDPGWKAYYTVNLLNLPNHYHNGGIWPFVGGFWVQFVNSLGMRNLAQRELYRLAKINETGVEHEWEFNEWMHGKTGRPMGKAFQAWSAAGYINAYSSFDISSGNYS